MQMSIFLCQVKLPMEFYRWSYLQNRKGEVFVDHSVDVLKINVATIVLSYLI